MLLPFRPVTEFLQFLFDCRGVISTPPRRPNPSPAFRASLERGKTSAGLNSRLFCSRQRAELSFWRTQVDIDENNESLLLSFIPSDCDVELVCMDQRGAEGTLANREIRPLVDGIQSRQCRAASVRARLSQESDRLYRGSEQS